MGIRMKNLAIYLMLGMLTAGAGNALEAETVTVQESRPAYVCSVEGCTQTGVHNHNVCGIEGCIRTEEHNHNVCGIEGCIRTEEHNHNVCGIEGCIQTGNHTHSNCGREGCTQAGVHGHNGGHKGRGHRQGGHH